MGFYQERRAENPAGVGRSRVEAFGFSWFFGSFFIKEKWTEG